jgi:hypothetical protein
VSVGYSLVAASAVVRIPVTVRSIGQDRFGLVLAIGVVWPLLATALHGVVRGSRIHLAESDGVMSTSAVATSLKPTVICGLVAAVLSLGLPFESLFSRSSDVSAIEIRAAAGLTVALVALCLPLAVGVGKLESVGRVGVFPVLAGVVSVVGALAAWGLARYGGGVFEFAALNVITSAAPYVFAWLLARRYLEHGALVVPPKGLGRTLLAQSLPSLTDFFKRGLDPLLLAIFASAAATVSWTVAQRLSLITTLVMLGSGPLISLSLARQRATAGSVGFRKILVVCSIQAMIAAAAGTFLVWFGPAVGSWLEDAPQDRGLYAAFAVLGVVWSVEETLRQTAAGQVVRRVGGTISVLAAALNLSASIAVAGRWGAEGVVWSSVGATAAAAAAWLVLFARSTAARSQVVAI